MKKNIKKYFCILSCIFMIVSILPKNVQASDLSNLTNEKRDISQEEEEKLIDYIGERLDVKEELLGEEYSTNICDVAEGEALENFDEELNPDRTDEGAVLLQDEVFVESYQSSFETKKLDNLTNSNFEISLAKYDGSYIHIDTANSYDKAVEVANTVEEIIDDYSDLDINEEYIPAVLDSNGTTVYATDSIARAIKFTNGVIDNSEVTYLYDDINAIGSKNTPYYINHNSIEDVAIVDRTSSAVKVLVNGYTGWAKSSTAGDGTYDFTIVPINQAYNPSYYIVKNNQLCHFISSDITDTEGKKGWTNSVGVAPSYLTANTKYYSYDAQYFYTSLAALEKDVQAGVHTNAVNSNSPYYNYYQKLPLRSKTSYSAAQLDEFINANTDSTSKLRGLGSALISAQNTYGVNAAMILAVAINESGWGMSKIAQEKNNLFGLNAVDYNAGQAANTYKSPADCVEQFAKYYMSKGYLNPEDWRYYGGIFGNKELGIGVKYASDPYWGEKNAGQFFAIDRYLSGYNNSGYAEEKLRDYRKYSVAVYNTNTNVTFKDNTTIYDVRGKKQSRKEITGSSVILKSLNAVNVQGTSKYEVTPEVTDKINSSSSFSGEFNWNTSGYVPANAVNIIAERKLYGIEYQTHIQNVGWQDLVGDSETSGIEGSNLRIEALKVNLVGYSGASIRYRTHIQNVGWQEWKNGGELSGTEGKSLRIEAMQVEASGLPDDCMLEYRAYIQGQGWQEWKSSGEIAGTTGKNLRIEAIQMRIVNSMPTIKYASHVQNIGWQGWKEGGATSGTEGQGLRVEAIKMKIEDYPGVKLQYRAHVQNIGWQSWVSNGATAGTEGRNLRVEAIQIKASGLPSAYQIQYRVHVQNIGWQDWKNAGETAGTTGKNYRIEAIQIRVVKANPTIEYKTYVQSIGWQDWAINGATAGTEGKSLRLEAVKIKIAGMPNATIEYRAHVQNVGWQQWKKCDEVAGTEGRNLRMEALQIKASGLPDGYELQYRVHVQNEGWQQWKKSGEIAGTEGKKLRIEALQVRIVKK